MTSDRTFMTFYVTSRDERPANATLDSHIDHKLGHFEETLSYITDQRPLNNHTRIKLRFLTVLWARSWNKSIMCYNVEAIFHCDIENEKRQKLFLRNCLETNVERNIVIYWYRGQWRALDFHGLFNVKTLSWRPFAHWRFSLSEEKLISEINLEI